MQADSEDASELVGTALDGFLDILLGNSQRGDCLVKVNGTGIFAFKGSSAVFGAIGKVHSAGHYRAVDEP